MHLFDEKYNKNSAIAKIIITPINSKYISFQWQQIWTELMLKKHLLLVSILKTVVLLNVFMGIVKFLDE